jgi:type II secretion system protein C
VQNWNWFNNALEAPVARQQQVAQALADAKINADLLGVVISDEISTATIKYKGQPEAVYLMGDDLLAGMKIVKIEAQRIVVEQGGVQKQILLKKPESIFQSEVVSENSNSDLEQSGFRLANMCGAVPVRLASGGGAETAGFKLNGLSAEMRSLADIEDGDVVVSVSGSSVTELMENPAAWMSLSGQSNLPLTIIRDGQEMVIYVNAASLSAKMLPMMGKIR